MDSPSRGSKDQSTLSSGGTIKGSAIRGSSLLNTSSDLRSILQRGSSVLINEVSYDTAITGEWNANCIQLATDYAGETNFSVTIRVPNASLSPKRKKGGATKVEQSNISSTVQHLDSINETLAAMLHAQDAAGISTGGQRGGAAQRQRKGGPPKQKRKPEAAIVQSNLQTDDLDEETYVDNAPQEPSYAANSSAQSGELRKPPRKLPPLPDPSKLDNVAERAPASMPSSEKVDRPKSRTGIPVPQSKAGRGENAHSSSGPTDTSRSKIPPARTKPTPTDTHTTTHAPKSRTAHESIRESEAEQDDENDEEGGATKATVSEQSLAERRRAAAERVKRKLKEDQERVEREAAQKEAELKAQHEASLTKARELQARTAARVEQYLEDKQRKEMERKAIAAYEKQQRELVNQEYLSSAKFQKMKDIRKEAKSRLQQIEQEEFRQAVETAEQRQKQLFERHKKYDVNTTFLPRLDGLPAQGAGSNGQRGLKDGSKVPVNRVVKSLAAEMEQLESTSGTFPEEPVLRSRSAKQALRIKNSGQAGGAGAGAGAGGAGNNGSKSAGVSVGAGAGGQGLSARRAESLPAVGLKGAGSSVKQPRAKDEDDWSDDEPDSFLQGKQHLLFNAQGTNYGGQGQCQVDYDNEEDSLMNGQGRHRDGDRGMEDEYGRLDDEMEMELFGRIHRSPVVKGKVIVKAPPVAPSGAIKPQPTGAVQTGGRFNKKADIDDAASDCSDLTTDSMGRGRHKSNAPSRSTKPLQTPQALHPTPTQPARPRSGSKLPRPTVPAASAALGADYSFALPVAFQNTTTYTFTPQQLQQQVQFAGPVLATPAPAVRQQSDDHSSQTPSPTRSKGKATFRKLKPIPISQPYRPVPLPAAVHE